LDDGPALPFGVLEATLRLMIGGESSSSTVAVLFWAVCLVFLLGLLGSEDIAASCLTSKGEVGKIFKVEACLSELSKCADKMD
jgi:hypothetical protein